MPMINKARNSIKTVAILVAVIVCLYLLVGLYLFLNQRSLLYFPTESYAHDFDTERFLHDGESIEVIVANPGKQSAILYFGGNAEPAALSATHSYASFPDYSIYLVNYRGYAGSSGQPTESGLYSDAEYIYDQIKQRHTQVAVVGRSLGTGIAAFLASVREVQKLVLITPYDSIGRVAQGRFPLFPASLLLKDQYNSLSRVDHIEADTLLVLAEHDQVIPKKHSLRLLAAFPEQQVSVHEIAGSDHNTLSDDDGYYPRIRDFLSSK